MDTPANPVASPSPDSAQSLLDPQLAGYELLRRLICGRPPFEPLKREQSALPSEFKSDIEFGTWTYQISLYLEAVKVKFGLPVSEKIRTQLLLLSAFDASLESRLVRFFDAISTAEGKYADAGYVHFFPEDPAVSYYAVLAVVFLIVSGCPEERQRPLLVPVIEHLVMARARAETIFGRELGPFQGVGDRLAPWRPPKTDNNQELGSIVGVSESFQWSAEPGPFERQLRRQQDNPLFRVTERTISAGQVTGSRLADLKRMADFVSSFRPIEQEVQALPAKSTVKDATDLQKRVMDLIPPCLVLGDFFSREMKLLTTVSESIEQQLDATIGTQEPGLRSAYDQYMSLARLEGYVLEFSVVLPSGEEEHDCALRIILSEDLGFIQCHARLHRELGGRLLGDDPLDSVQRIIREAVRDGLDPDLGRQKLEAFRSGMAAGRGQPKAGFWAKLRETVRESRHK